MKTPISLGMIAWASLLVGGVTSSPVSPPSPPPFDADLFHRDEQVLSVHGSFLFWRVQEGALDYALKMNESVPANQTSYALGKFQNATFSGEPGFRVAASFFRAPKYWEFWGQYTRLSAKGKNSASAPEAANQFLTGTWPQIFTDPLAQASSYIHMNYNVADLLIDRVFFPNPHLRLRLLGGGSAAWIDQFWKIRYHGEAGSETKIGNRWKFIGGGLKAGLLFDWYWFTNVYMTGGSTFGALLGSYHNKAFEVSNGNTVRNARFEDIRPTFATQFYLGPSYQKNFSKHRMELFAGYELNAWFNLQEIYRSTSGTPEQAKETWINTGILALQGLTTRLTIDF